jgi:hypothetical protein
MDQRVVSLGGNCMVTKEMRLFYGVEAANMFDWWITPVDGLIQLIENDFDGLFERENLQMVGDRRSVANLRYGILHHHDFLRNDEEDRVVEMDEEQRLRNVQKFAYLKRRWDDLAHNQGPVLFVRWGWSMSEALLAGITPDPFCANPARLVATLDRKFPQLDYQILLIDAPEVNHECKKVLYRDTHAFTGPGERLNVPNLLWEDNTRIFTRLFSSVDWR